MDERLRYIASRRIHDDICILEGLSYDGYFYTALKIDTGEIIHDAVIDLRNKRFDFGDFGKFSFHNSTIREVRRRDMIEKLEMEYGGGSYEHFEWSDLISMPWERIWEVLSEYNRGNQLPELKLVA